MIKKLEMATLLQIGTSTLLRIQQIRPAITPRYEHHFDTTCVCGLQVVHSAFQNFTSSLTWTCICFSLLRKILQLTSSRTRFYSIISTLNAEPKNARRKSLLSASKGVKCSCTLNYLLEWDGMDRDFNASLYVYIYLPFFLPRHFNSVLRLLR